MENICYQDMKSFLDFSGNDIAVCAGTLNYRTSPLLKDIWIMSNALLRLQFVTFYELHYSHMQGHLSQMNSYNGISE